jgi:hypothetical protein
LDHGHLTTQVCEPFEARLNLVCILSVPFFFHAGINLTAQSNKGQLDAYIKSAEWDLEGKLDDFIIFHFVCFVADFSAINNALKYDCCPDLYPFVLYTIRIRRRSLYYFTNIVSKKK